VEPGPVGDYCFPLCAAGVTGAPSETANHWLHYNQTNVDHYAKHGGPTRVAIHTSQSTTNDSKTWYPRDTFTWLQDGTSNQIMIGEKHIPTNRVDKCRKDNNNRATGASNPDPDILDCSYMNTGGSRTYSAARPIRRALYSNATVPDSNSDTSRWQCNGIHRIDECSGDDQHPQNIGFGSCHPGSSNNLFGDGSVRSLPPTIPAVLVAMLCFTFDGNNATLP